MLAQNAGGSELRHRHGKLVTAQNDAIDKKNPSKWSQLFASNATVVVSGESRTLQNFAGAYSVLQVLFDFW